MQDQKGWKAHKLDTEGTDEHARRLGCLKLAQVFRTALETTAKGSGGGLPGEETFPALRAALAAEDELYPQQAPALLDLEPQSSDQFEAAAGGKGERSCKCKGRASLSSPEPRDSTQATLEECAAVGQDGQRILPWLKAGQIWLLCEARASTELEGVCRRPGVDLRGVGTKGIDLLEVVVASLSCAGCKGASGLLLHACGNVAGALAEWQDAYETDREAATCLLSHPNKPEAPAQEHPIDTASHSQARFGESVQHHDGVGMCQRGGNGEKVACLDDIGESRSVEEHVLAAALASGEGSRGYVAAARALLSAARAADLLCCSQKVPELTDAHIGWLLQMPSQCALGVLSARRDMQPEDLFSPCHGLNGSDEGALDAVQLWLQVCSNASER
jgi:hypothetical protein